jgi:CheY-like chemotaxis protein
MSPQPLDVARRPSVLVVEDEPLVRSLVAELLRVEDIVVIEASNAAEALAYLSTGQPVDLVFTDIRMPGMSGVELAAVIRARFPGVRIILTSGDAGPVNLNEFGSFIAKPYPVQEAVEMVRGLLKQAPNHDQS